MWFTILMVMLFIYISLGIVVRFIDIYKFLTKNSEKENIKQKLVE